MEARGFSQISDEAEIAAMVDSVLAQCPQELEQYRGGKTKLQGHFTGYALLANIMLEFDVCLIYSLPKHVSMPSFIQVVPPYSQWV